MITLVDLHNTHVLNYTRNIFKKLHTKHQKTFSNSFSRSLPNTGKWDNFLENALWKINHFPVNVNAKTNKAVHKLYKVRDATLAIVKISFLRNLISRIK